MKDISVADKRLGIPEQFFTRNSHGHGGFVIDSGSAFSHLVDYPFSSSTGALISYFPKGSAFRATGEMLGFSFCVSRPANVGLQQLPSVTLHFDDADLEMGAHKLYVLGERSGIDSYFCLTILRAKSLANIFGAYHQTNQRYICDTENLNLQFVPEDCAQHAWLISSLSWFSIIIYKLMDSVK